jgi:hypothetical protein
MNGDWHIFYTTPDNYVENTVIEGYGPSFQLKSCEEFTADSLESYKQTESLLIVFLDLQFISLTFR